MTDTHPILCPIDLDDLHSEPLSHAVDFSNALGTTLHVLHVEATATGQILAEDHREMLARVEAFVQKLPKQSLKQELHVLGGNPYSEIIRLAEKLSVRMIVMGTHGRTGLERAFVGSVAELVVRHAECPVLVVPFKGEN